MYRNLIVSIMFQGMAIFIDRRVQAPYPGHNRDIHWHKTQALLAVGSFNETTGAAVTVYQEEVLFYCIILYVCNFCAFHFYVVTVTAVSL